MKGAVTCYASALATSAHHQAWAKIERRLRQRRDSPHLTSNSSSHDAGTFFRLPAPPSPDCAKHYRHLLTRSVVPQVFPHQAEACQSAEAEPPDPPVDPPPYRKHHQVHTACFFTRINRLLRFIFALRNLHARPGPRERNIGLWMRAWLIEHEQVQRQEEALAQDQARHLSVSPLPSPFPPESAPCIGRNRLFESFFLRRQATQYGCDMDFAFA